MASPQIETVSSGVERAKYAAAVLLLVGGIAAYYLLSKQGGLAQWSALLVAVAASVAVFLVSEAGKRLVGFGQESWREVGKVVWPSRKESTQMTLYVFGFVVVMALFLWLTDKTLEWLIFDLILGWRR
jgi:preprotein translocase subunit SecE